MYNLQLIIYNKYKKWLYINICITQKVHDKGNHLEIKSFRIIYIFNHFNNINLIDLGTNASWDGVVCKTNN